jgi:PAS domain-containing protein
MHGDGLARHLANERALVLGTPMETTAVRVDQRELTVELTVKRTELDGQLCVIVYVRDVTARRQADEELRRHAAYLAEGHRLTRAGLWVWNPGTDAGFASEETHRLFGLSPGDPARATLADFLPRVHAADRPVLNAALERARREHAAFEVRFRVVHPDGALRYLSTRGHPMSASGAAQDEPREFVGTVVDVTDRRRAEEEQVRHAREVALRADVSGALARVDTLRGMLQGCADALVTHLDAAFARIWTLRRGADVLDLQASAGAYTRLDGRYAHVRVGELKIGLIARERVPYLTNDVLGDPRIENKEWARREGMVAFAGYPLVVEERVVGVMAVFARHTLAPQTLDALTSISAAVAQGVERKRSEEELRRSEAYLAEGQQLSHTGSWAWNLVTGELFFSAEWYRIYGFDPAGPAPAYDAVLARAHPDDVAGVDTALKDAFQAGTELRLLTRILVPGQPMKWVQTYGHPVHDVDGALVEFRGTVIDVTHEVHANRRRRRAIKGTLRGGARRAHAHRARHARRAAAGPHWNRAAAPRTASPRSSGA